MKKILFAVIGFLIVGCSNPSMERGLESLNAALAELEASIIALDIEQMEADLIAMNDQLSAMIVDVEEVNQTMEDALIQIEGILASLDRVRINLENAVTVEQVAALGESFAEIREKVELLVFLADYDYDGVINGLDQCPDTPITEINEVNEVGCSPSQLND